MTTPSGTTNSAAPSLAAFRRLAADRRVIPVVRRILADGETPVALYRKLTSERPGSFLLESAEHGIWSRFSFVGVRSAAMLTATEAKLSGWAGRLRACRSPDLRWTPCGTPSRCCTRNASTTRFPASRRSPEAWWG